MGKILTKAENSQGGKNRWKGISAKKRSEYARMIAIHRWAALTPEQRSEWRLNRANPRNVRKAA